MSDETCPVCGQPKATDIMKHVNEDSGYCWRSEKHCRETFGWRQALTETKTKLADAERRLRQFQRCADALEDIADGKEPGCSVSNHPGIYECRPESPCTGCRARWRIQQSERVVAAADRMRAMGTCFYTADGRSYRTQEAKDYDTERAKMGDTVTKAR